MYTPLYNLYFNYFSEEGEGGGPVQLNRPFMVSVTQLSDSSLQATWTDPNSSPNESSIDVYIQPFSGSAVLYDSVLPDVTTLEITGLAPATFYNVYVQHKGDGENTLDSVVSNTIFGQTAAEGSGETLQLVAPTGVTATEIASTAIDVQWTDTNSEQSVGYGIERSANGSTGWTLIDTVDGNDEIYTDINLTPGTQYYYRVRAIGNGTNILTSTYSSSANDTTRVAPVGTAQEIIFPAIGKRTTADPDFWDHNAYTSSGEPIEFELVSTVRSNIAGLEGQIRMMHNVSHDVTIRAVQDGLGGYDATQVERTFTYENLNVGEQYRPNPLYWLSTYTPVLHTPTGTGNIIYVAVGGTGDGSELDPYGDIQTAVTAALPGDVVRIAAGTYDISTVITTERDGTSANRITIECADLNDRPILNWTGTTSGWLTGIFNVDHDYITVNGILIDGNHQNCAAFFFTSSTNSELLHSELKCSNAGGLTIGGCDNILVEGCEIHHCFNGTSWTGYDDSHLITGIESTNVTIRNSDLHHCTGDCIQVDPLSARSNQATWTKEYPNPDHWDNWLVDNCHLWTSPIYSSENTRSGFPIGFVPGENAIDLKTIVHDMGATYRGSIVVRGCEIHGWVDSIGEARKAALNIKYTSEIDVEQCYIYDCYIGARVRGDQEDYYEPTYTVTGSHPRFKNCVFFDNDIAFRCELDVENLRIYNCTFDKSDYLFLAPLVDYNPPAIFEEDSEGGFDDATLDVQNNLFIGTKPLFAADASNLEIGGAAFVDRTNHDYHLVSGVLAIDAGNDIAYVDTDMDGVTRPAGENDCGAFEYVA